MCAKLDREFFTSHTKVHNFIHHNKHSLFAEIQQSAIVNHTRISALAMAALVYHLVACKHLISVPKHLRISHEKQDVINLGR